MANRVKCIYCDKPIHIDFFAGICKKGMFCKSTSCLIKLTKEMEQSKQKHLGSDRR